jgi:hypothetical protein
MQLNVLFGRNDSVPVCAYENIQKNVKLCSGGVATSKD